MMGQPTGPEAGVHAGAAFIGHKRGFPLEHVANSAAWRVVQGGGAARVGDG